STVSRDASSSLPQDTDSIRATSSTVTSHPPSTSSPSKTAPKRGSAGFSRKGQPVKDKRVLKALEKSLLGSLGLKSRPRPKSVASVPPYMLQLYRRQANSQSPLNTIDSPFLQVKGRGGIAANTVRSFHHTGRWEKSAVLARGELWREFRAACNWGTTSRAGLRNEGPPRVADQSHDGAPVGSRDVATHPMAPGTACHESDLNNENGIGNCTLKREDERVLFGTAEGLSTPFCVVSSFIRAGLATAALRPEEEEECYQLSLEAWEAEFTTPLRLDENPAVGTS
ncbi:hypothetical protein BaRGS_00038082, partial [Batillaria attramentaria]